MPNTLELFSDYERVDIHGIFSPDTKFTPQAGTWGLQGIVGIPDRPKDYIFYVTFGQEQGDHQFDEFITEEGVLSWQSQPKQGFEDPRIQDFIEHREEVNNIHLFLRTEKGGRYTYFGRLKYLDHDSTKQKPVYFHWQIIDWPPPKELPEKIGLTLRSAVAEIPTPNDSKELPAKQKLDETFAPNGRKRSRETRGKSTTTLRPDYVANHIANQELGLKGEKLVVRIEIEKLIAEGRKDLAEKVRHVSVLENDTAGYDVLSYDSDGNKRFIEVKTTRGGIDSDFFISAGELAFSLIHSENYFLYRLYEYLDEIDSAKYFVIRGDLNANNLLDLAPTNFKVSIKNREI